MNTSNISSYKVNNKSGAVNALSSMHNTKKTPLTEIAITNIEYICNSAKSTGLKSIDQLILRHSVRLSVTEEHIANNVFQKSLVLYGQDQRLDYLNLPPCMYMAIAEAKIETKFVIHRFYLPYKNNERFAAYMLNEQGEIVESVCYQRNNKYLQAFKILRKQIAMACSSQQYLAA